MRSLLALLVAAFVIGLPGRLTEYGNITHILQCTGNPCTVRYNPGGNLVEFMFAAKSLLNEGRIMAIDGECDSACTIVADQLRYDFAVCVTPRAVMGFHRGLNLRTKKSFLPHYSPDIMQMVKKAGGFPEPEGINFFEYKDIRHLWPTCGFEFRWVTPRYWPFPTATAAQ